MMKKFKLLGLLGVFSLLFTCFSSAGLYSFTGTITNNSSYIDIQSYVNGCDFFVSCFYNNTNNATLTFNFGYNHSQYGFSSNSIGNVYLRSNTKSFGYDFNNVDSCTLVKNIQLYTNGSTYNYTCYLVGNSVLVSDCPTCPTCSPQYTSEQCQSVYGLVSSGDLSSCQSSLSSCQLSLSGWNNTLSHCSNSLNTCQSNLENCIQANCPSIDVNTGYSTLYINDIRHQSMPFIYVNIPEEFSWDYSTGINDFTIDISGYNVDTDYIAGIIDTQNYKPDESDFNKIITDVIPLFVPGLVIILFLYFIFRFIKKIF